MQPALCACVCARARVCFYLECIGCFFKVNLTSMFQTLDTLHATCFMCACVRAHTRVFLFGVYRLFF